MTALLSAAAVVTGLALHQSSATAGEEHPVRERAAAPQVRLVTANVPFGLSAKKAGAQLKHVLGSKADVLVLQEVRKRNVNRLLKERTKSGTWKVLQPKGAKGASAVAWNTARFSKVGSGTRPAFKGPDYSRHLLWVTLKDRVDGQLHTVIGLHYPPDSSKDPAMRKLYRTMNGNYRALVRDLRSHGRHPVAGGDWNHPLDVRREAWSPVPVNRGMAMTTNWLKGTPCASGTSARGGRIDGFAYDPKRTRLHRQGCMKRLHSDHRPVWISVSAR
ncbi:endonuclease/exonuclease/phosphatase family protein [Streptomyces sp. NPDC005438]|uniref:endonuclease/exonuclease/phosphatase family protein n=1 Tax=Streptomyces sp. NPDC005438 TaxID=3156880 RepID=UPI00339E8C01